MDDRLQARKQEFEAVLGRTLSPAVQDAPAPLSDEDLKYLTDQAEDLFWNELEWEHLTEEEQLDEGTLTEQAFPGFLAFIRGLLLDEVMPDALAGATPRPAVVREILNFLLSELDRFRGRLDAGEGDADRLKAEISMTEGLVDLTLATLMGLTAADLERLSEARAGS